MCAFQLNADVALHNGPNILAGGVISFQGWLLGIQSRYEMSINKLKVSLNKVAVEGSLKQIKIDLQDVSFAVGRKTPDYALHSFIKRSGAEFGASIYHRVNTFMELGAQFGWTMGERSATNFGLASRFTADTLKQI